MPSPTEPLREHPSTYYVQDRSNLEEMTRLDIQDKMLNIGMGGALPELEDPMSLRRVLDVGCGTGAWLLEVAKTYPMIEKLIGVDVSAKIVSYACTQAKAQGLADRVQFQTMDALRILEFPPASFDLLNQRGGLGWLRTGEWTKILLEYQRVTKPGAIIRITEGNITAESNSPALTKLYSLVLEAAYRSGRLFTPQTDGVASELARLMTQHGIADVQSRAHPLVHRAGTETGQYFYEDMARLFRLVIPFLQKWTRVPDDYEQTYQQMLQEMQQPDFEATLTLLTVWGRRIDGAVPRMRGLM